MMVIDMKAILKMIKLKEKEYIIIMVKDMKGIGKMIKKIEKEYFIIMIIPYMKVIGKII